MDIGKPVETVIVEPVVSPVPADLPDPSPPSPSFPEPDLQPEPIPA